MPADSGPLDKNNNTLAVINISTSKSLIVDRKYKSFMFVCSDVLKKEHWRKLLETVFHSKQNYPLMASLIYLRIKNFGIFQPRKALNALAAECESESAKVD